MNGEGIQSSQKKPADPYWQGSWKSNLFHYSEIRKTAQNLGWQLLDFQLTQLFFIIDLPVANKTMIYVQLPHFHAAIPQQPNGQAGGGKPVNFL